MILVAWELAPQAVGFLSQWAGSRGMENAHHCECKLPGAQPGLLFRWFSYLSHVDTGRFMPWKQLLVSTLRSRRWAAETTLGTLANAGSTNAFLASQLLFSESGSLNFFLTSNQVLTFSFVFVDLYKFKANMVYRTPRQPRLDIETPSQKNKKNFNNTNF